MSDDIDRLSDEALFDYLTEAASEGGMRLLIEQRGDEWFAEARAASGAGWLDGGQWGQRPRPPSGDAAARARVRRRPLIPRVRGSEKRGSRY